MGLEDRAAAGFFGEQDFRDIEQPIDTSDLLDFLADETDGRRVWRNANAHAVLWADFLKSRWAIAAVIGATATFIKWSAWGTIAVARASSTSWSAVTILASLMHVAVLLHGRNRLC
jgi:hypothetical protein